MASVGPKTKTAEDLAQMTDSQLLEYLQDNDYLTLQNRMIKIIIRAELKRAVREILEFRQEGIF